ncbi:long-chain fatty acid--CoA ligase [Emcibacter sp. SYSU 3D8]|uniref:AMP-dependent synthetase/ligase n=1 Tax=Emcibacter sp. SYSU 3D8 TaxID=3133969 RepID=UPI0031FF09DB
MTADKARNLVDMFLDQAERRGERPCVWSKPGTSKTFQPVSWRQVAEQVARLAAALKDMGIRPGDRVALVSESRPEWLIADLGIMAAGAVTVPTYTTNTERDHAHILNDSGARGAIVSTARLARALLPAAMDAGSLDFVIAMEQPKLAQSLNLDVHLWQDVIANSKGTVAATRAGIAGIGRDDLACLIYTSGTGGAPKGVMISHGAILHNCTGASEVIAELGLDDGLDKTEVFLSFLPLSHAYEHSGGQFFPLSIGAQIYYAESIEKLAANMAECRPTIMTVVPRLFEMLRTRVTRAIEEQGGTRARLFHRAVQLGEKRFNDRRSLSLGERIENVVLDKLVRRKVQQRFGGRVKALVSGGAPLNSDVGLFFHALGLRLLQGYGQTESGPVVSVNRPGLVKIHTVGPPMKATEVRIAEDGEILIRGELVMKGYWRDDAATARTIIDGWLHTGDIGIIDEDGHLQITDRKKDIIVNDKGDNVAPARVEGLLTLEPEIGQAMLYGDRRPHMVGLLVPDMDWAAKWAGENGKTADMAALSADPAFHTALDKAVGRVNQRLSSTEKIRRFAVATAPFSIDNEQMTPTMKIRRHVIVRNYKDVLDALY